MKNQRRNENVHEHRIRDDGDKIIKKFYCDLNYLTLQWPNFERGK